MIERYSLPEMENLWSDQTKFEKMLEIEILACEALAKKGIITEKELDTLKKKAKVDIKDIRKKEKISHHETVAFLDSISGMISPSFKYLHFGLTSSDTLDTALSLVMRESLDLIVGQLKILRKNLLKQAKRNKDLVMIGRTHGAHGEPITLGLKFLNWVYEVERCLERLENTKETVSYGKISGSVGTYANVKPFVEKYVCKKLKIKSATISNQILQRDRHAEYVFSIAMVGNLLEKIAMEIRHLHRTEIGELGEPFSSKQKGSSSMPHKKNPIVCEQICGLSRVLRGNLVVAMENTPLWDERDISHSSAERVILPDSSTLVHYMLDRMNFVIENVVINKENIKRNLELTKGKIFSQALMLKLVSNGMEKGKAYDLIQSLSFEDTDDFINTVLEDRRGKGFLKEKDGKDLRDYSYYTKHVDEIFKRFE